MRELPSTLNPAEVTSRWTQTFERSNPKISNRDLFELTQDIVWLNWQDFQEYHEVYLRLPLDEHSRLADVSIIDESEAEKHEAITLFVTEGKGHDRILSLRHSLTGRKRFSTLLHSPEAYSMLAGHVLKEDTLERVNLKPQVRRDIARNLWRAHLYTLQSEQRMTDYANAIAEAYSDMRQQDQQASA